MSKEVEFTLTVDKKLLFINKYVLLFAENSALLIMYTSPLVRPLARLFTYLFYIQLGLYPVVIPLFVFLMRTWVHSHSSSPAADRFNGSDTLLVNGRKMAVEHYDTTGRQHITTDPAALTLASINKVDSAFETNLNADFAVTQDGYFVRRPNPARAFVFTLPLNYRVVSFMLDDSPDPAKRYALPRPSNNWYHRFQFGPVIKLAEPFGQQNDGLVIEVTSWQDVVAIPNGLKLALLLLLLPAVFVLLVTYQFMQLFKSLARDDVFSERQLRRVRFIGYYALVYVLFRFCAMIGISSLASRYIKNTGAANLDSMMQWGFPPVELSWLLMGLCVLALAQVFTYGLRLKQENELTI